MQLQKFHVYQIDHLPLNHGFQTHLAWCGRPRRWAFLAAAANITVPVPAVKELTTPLLNPITIAAKATTSVQAVGAFLSPVAIKYAKFCCSLTP